MHLCYVLLSPTFGMHQYTADLANHMARLGHAVCLVTTARHPNDRYLPTVQIKTPIESRNTGLSAEGLHFGRIQDVLATIRRLQPELVHITGPHLWNLHLLHWLRRQRLPVIHTLHDLDPHSGTAYGPLLYGWNMLVARLADHILVHGDCYREKVIAMGVAPDCVTYVPLLHLFLGHTWLEDPQHLTADVTYEPWALFFGRLSRYKGIDHLLTACAMFNSPSMNGPRLVLAGSGSLSSLWAGALPPSIEVRDHLIEDREALDLFRRCGLLVLPYLDATQSALIPAAYFFRKPVVVTWTGALPEYVQDGRTGWLVEADHPPSLARRLELALSDPERLARMGAAGRAWYDQQRTEEQRTLEQLYERLARRRQ